MKVRWKTRKTMKYLANTVGRILRNKFSSMKTCAKILLDRMPLTACPALILILVFQAFLLMSCSSKTLRPYSHTDITINQLGKIAVLPLQNLTVDNFAAKKIEGLLIMDFLARGIDVIEPGEVMSVLRQYKAQPINEMPVADLQKIGEMIHADAVIIGSVGTFAINKGMSVAYPEVSVHFIMIDILSGNIVWSAWHTSGGPDFWTRHFGAEGATLDEIAREVVKDSVDTLF